MKRSSSRFQSNHQRGYFCRNTIIRRGAKKSSPPAPAATSRPWWPEPPPAQTPSTVPRTTRVGIASMIRKAVVSRFSSRSGFSTSNCTGYGASLVGSIARLLGTRDPLLQVYPTSDRLVLDPKRPVVSRGADYGCLHRACDPGGRGARGARGGDPHARRARRVHLPRLLRAGSRQ